VNYPGGLNEAVAQWLAAQGGSQRAAVQKLQAAYRQGFASETDDLAVYLTARLPATFAVNKRVMAEVAARAPDFAPASVLDCGAGPGTATWATLDQWPSLQQVTQLEVLPAFCELADTLNAGSELAALQGATVLRGDIRARTDVKADLVIASYVLAEVAEDVVVQLARDLWQRASSVLILIEPGTPTGFARINAARETLRTSGHILAPCTHAQACPMTSGNWCHFKTRLARSRAHMHAKAATVPFEDEAFSYLIVSRAGFAATGQRIIAPVTLSKASAELQLCDAAGLRRETIASRNKPAYKRAKKARWGDVWE
jgi:ribosomal protein RSM22 (predicted rRNA methylase)